MLQPGLILKQGVFSAGKTSNSIRAIQKFNPFEQINITNQPTGYTHILIKSGDDLINLLKDIYDYNLYITGYQEKKEYYDLLVDTLDAYNTDDFFAYFGNAKNILLKNSYFKNLFIRYKIKLGKIQTLNLEKGQILKEIKLLDKYFKEREVIVQKYGDLMPGYFNFIVLDELHLYFGTRNFKTNFSGKNEFLMDFVAFPVKLNTRIEGIAQNVNALDIVFRRQCSLYMKHDTSFFGLLGTTRLYDMPDPEHPLFIDEYVVEKSRSINWYKIFGIPKLQYYRNHIILANKDDSIYTPGDYLEYISYMTKQLENKENKEKKNKKYKKEEKEEIKKDFKRKIL